MQKTEAVVFDLDDTLFKKSPLERAIIRQKKRRYPIELPTYTREEIACLDINHSPTEHPPIDLRERLSLKLIARSRLFPGIANEFKILADQGLNIFINTGRPNKSVWADITDETLNREGIKDFVKGIFYTPKNIDVAVSKAHTLYLLGRDYNILGFSDDDIRVAQYTALIFSEISINLIRNDHPRISLEPLPNLKITPSIITRQGNTI